MGVKTESDTGQHQRLEDVKKLASRIMHMHYCEHDIEGITSCFSEQFSWMGAGEQEYLSGRQACADHFRKFRESIPDCNIWDEEYDVVCPMENVYVVMGRMWIATDPGTRMYLKVHQRVTFVFRDTEDGLTCSHIHCSNPYQEMLDGESFPEKIGRQSYEYVQERLNALEEETKQQNRQLEVIMSSIAGGLIQIARELGIHIIAEGVETENQLNALNNYQCEYQQGFYYAPTMEKETLIKVLGCTLEESRITVEEEKKKMAR